MEITDDNSTHIQCFEVSIVDDGLIEGTESFSLFLSLRGNGSRTPVIIRPETSTVWILDNDCKYMFIYMLRMYYNYMYTYMIIFCFDARNTSLEGGAMTFAPFCSS